MKKALWLLVLALATGLIAAGCGDDDDDDGGNGGGNGGEALTKQEFITQADQICSEGNAEIEAGAEDTFGGSDQPPSPAEEEQFATDTVIPSIQSQVDQIGELASPEGDEDQVQAILDAAQEGLDAGNDDPSLFAGENQDPLAEATRLAKQYGLKVCGA